MDSAEPGFEECFLMGLSGLLDDLEQVSKPTNNFTATLAEFLQREEMDQDRPGWLMISVSDGEVLFTHSKEHSFRREFCFLTVPGNLLRSHRKKNSKTGRVIDRDWIDFGLLCGWKHTCEEQHHQTGSSASESSRPRPRIAWLIDVFQLCLVKGTPEHKYVALSYVWGNSTVLKTTRRNLETLSIPGIFAQPGYAPPKTIIDSMNLVRALGERYLWVDALCIVQDDKEIRQLLVDNMAAVYANATLTIVAANGTNADAGLKGLRDISGPRESHCWFRWPDGTCLSRPNNGKLAETTWSERGWTFQEYAFSRRRLVFFAESVRWECGESIFWEEHQLVGTPPSKLVTEITYDDDSSYIRTTPQSITFTFPNLERLNNLVYAYNRLSFTNDEDNMDAFSGIVSLMTPAFEGGFLWGLPVMFLDICLHWRTMHDDSFRRRWNPSGEGRHSDKFAPTWSWVAWQGFLWHYGWNIEDYILQTTATPYDGPEDGDQYTNSPLRTIPLVRWSIRQTAESPPSDIPHQNEWYDWKMRYAGSAEHDPLPPGWTRRRLVVDFVDQAGQIGQADPYHYYSLRGAPPFYYTHESVPSTQFNYPIPLGSRIGRRPHPHHAASSSSMDDVAPHVGRYLCCSTRRAFLGLSIQGPPDYMVQEYELVDPEYGGRHHYHPEPHGTLNIHDHSLAAGLHAEVGSKSAKDPLVMVELVAVSMKYTTQWNYGEYRWDEPLGEETPQEYNVFFVEWVDGVAYRKGCGDVRRDVWDSREREEVELILG